MDDPAPTPLERARRQALDRYWKRNLRIMGFSLLFWALLSFGCGILWADALNRFQLFGTGFPLGFWFAQQGSIIGFVLIVLVYAILMNRADRRHHQELTEMENRGEGQGGEGI